jgi:hypothetical protein
MPHAFAFDPPVRGNRRGPLLKIQLKAPLTDSSLTSRAFPVPDTPYRKSRDVENLLDDIAFRTRPAEKDDALLIVSLGLVQGKTRFDPSPNHVHNTDELMRPDVLIGHSSGEGAGRIVKIAVMDELCILAATLLRELGQASYLSTISTPEGSCLSGVAVLNEKNIDSFTLAGAHPSVSRLVVFDDAEVVSLLRLLKAHNCLRLLYDQTKERSHLSSAEEARYRHLIGEFGLGTQSAHHLVGIIEDVFLAFAKRFPDLLEKN